MKYPLKRYTEGGKRFPRYVFPCPVSGLGRRKGTSRDSSLWTCVLNSPLILGSKEKDWNCLMRKSGAL